MSALINNEIGCVCIPVSDMPRAIDWYSRLFGFERGAPSHDGGIYDVPMRGEAGLIPDANTPVTGHSAQPLCFFWTDGIVASLTRLQSLDAKITSDVTDIGSVAFLAFRDPDGNPLMICQRQ